MRSNMGRPLQLLLRIQIRLRRSGLEYRLRRKGLLSILLRDVLSRRLRSIPLLGGLSRLRLLSTRLLHGQLRRKGRHRHGPNRLRLHDRLLRKRLLLQSLRRQSLPLIHNQSRRSLRTNIRGRHCERRKARA